MDSTKAALTFCPGRAIFRSFFGYLPKPFFFVTKMLWKSREAGENPARSRHCELSQEPYPLLFSQN
jgi:hypothetical protein